MRTLSRQSLRQLPCERSVRMDIITRQLPISTKIFRRLFEFDSVIQKAKFVMAKLKKKNVTMIKRSDLFQMCRGKFFKKTEEIFPTLELLEGHGYLRMEEPERQSAGRPADVRIFVNPAAA